MAEGVPLVEAVTLRIDKGNDDATPTIRLTGRIRSVHLSALQTELEEHPQPTIIDLGEVTNLDVEAIRFLGARELEGYELNNCSPFIREWIDRERAMEQRQ